MTNISFPVSIDSCYFQAMRNLATGKIELAKRVENLSGSVAREILSRTRDYELISFAGGLPDANLWRDIGLPSLKQEGLQYGASEGEGRLLEQFSEILAARGLEVSSKRILITAGSQQGLDLAAKLLIDPGSPIALEAPTYLAALQVFELFQAQIFALPVLDGGMSPDELDRLLRKQKPRFLYLNPTFQNPSGVCYDLDRRKAIATVLDRHNAVLIEDDPYRDLCYEETPRPPIASFLKRASWIYLSSVSKTLMPGLRIGYLASSGGLFPYLSKLKQAADLHSSRLSQLLASEVLADRRSSNGLLARSVASYRLKRDKMEDVLSEHFSDIASWNTPPGGMFFWLRLRDMVDQKKLLDRCLASRVAFMPGDPFFTAPNKTGHWIRLNFTNPPIEKIEDGLLALRKNL